MTKQAELDIGLVVAGHGRHYVIETPGGRRLICHPRGKKSDCVVGDAVRWRPTGDAEGVIEHLEPRRNVFFRQDEWKTKSFAANIDQLLVLVAADPPFGESQLARALIAAESAGIDAHILLNKADLPQFAAARTRLAPYAAMGVDVIEAALKADPAAARAKPRRAARGQGNARARAERHRQEHADQPACARRAGAGRRGVACAERGPAHDDDDAVVLARRLAHDGADRFTGLPGIRFAPTRAG